MDDVPEIKNESSIKAYVIIYCNFLHKPKQIAIKPIIKLCTTQFVRIIKIF